MRLFQNIFKTLVIATAVCSSPMVHASVADDYDIPAADATARVGALMPYVRYDSQQASLSGGAWLKSTSTMDRYDVASQASDQSYVELPGSGASAEWTMNSTGRGVTMRFTMPDTSDGMGQSGSLDVYVNDVKVKTVSLSSYWMWQYFTSGNPQDTPGGIGCFAFDEVHFLLDKSLAKGDRIKIQSSGDGGLTYGVDFLEIEEVADPIECPDNAVNVVDYGANPDDGADDLAAFVAAVEAADRGSKVVYIPEGTWHLGGMWNIYCQDVKITGAGIWHTNIQFTSDKASGGGISGGNASNGGADGYCKNLEFCNMYINSRLRSRYNQQAVYKCFMDVFTDGSVFHDVWEEHFECGFWFGDYNGSMDYSDGVKVISCRIRNNLADGVNFCQGTSNATVYNCSIRNNGDDGLACWNNNYMNAKDETGNVFAYNTIDFIWRAGGIALYGGSGHKIYNNYIRDMFMAAGIHLNTTFDGYKFVNNQGISFDNNILVHCGTNADSWSEDLAGIDIKQDVRNVTFNNTQIYNSPFDAIRTMTGPNNVTFNNTKILGTGLTGESTNYSCVEHTCGAIRYADGNVKFNGLEVGCYGEDRKGNNSTYPFWTDNNSTLAASLGATLLGNDIDYVVPDYSEADNSQQGGGVVDPLDGISGYDVTVTALSWKNQSGSTTIIEGDRVSFSVTVKNASDVDIPAKAKIAVQVAIDGGTTRLTQTLRDGLAAGASLTFTPSTTWTAVKGGHTAVATVDPSNVLDKELSEDNNTRTKRFNVTEDENAQYAFTAVTGGYDLVVTKVFVSGQDAISTGDHLVFGAVIANAGDTDIPSGTKIGIQFQIDGKAYDQGYITWCDSYKDGLKSHATATLIANGGGGQNYVTNDNYWTAEEGTHTVTAWVDDTNGWSEVNENNNKTTITLTIPYGGTTYFDNPDLPDTEDGGEAVETVKTAIVNGVKYELYGGTAQVVGWDGDTFPSDGIVIVESSVKIGDNYYDVKKIVGGQDDKLSGRKEDAAAAFIGCQQLKGIVLPEGIETVGDHAFKGSGLEYLNFPNTLSTIGSWAFEGCKLTNITLPWTLKSLGEGAFYDNGTLTTVTIAADLASLPNMAFHCPDETACLKDVYFCLDYALTGAEWTFNPTVSPRFHAKPGAVDTWKAAGYDDVDSDVIISLPESGIAARSFAFDVDFAGSGVSAYKGAYSSENDNVTMTEVTRVSAANGVVVKASDGSDAAGKEYKAKMCEGECSDFSGNRLWQSINSTYVTDQNCYVLDGTVFRRISGSAYVPSWSAYLSLGSDASGVKSELAPDFRSSTGISTVNTSSADNGAYYTVGGVRVSRPAGGLIIHNGKKFAASGVRR